MPSIFPRASISLDCRSSRLVARSTSSTAFLLARRMRSILAPRWGVTRSTRWPQASESIRVTGTSSSSSQGRRICLGRFPRPP